MKEWKQRLLKKIKSLAAIITMSSALVAFQVFEQRAMKRKAIENSLEQLEQVIDSEIAHLQLVRRLPSFGFGNVIADATFVSFLQYFGDTEVRKKTGYAASPVFFETVLSQDSYYRPFYVFLSGSTTLHAANPEKTVELMSSALSTLSPNTPPDGYYIWRYKAVDELLFLGDGNAAQKSFQMAAEWAQQSDSPDAHFVSEISQRTASFLAENPDSRVAQIDAWSSLLGTALDQASQVRAMERIEALGGSVIISEEGGISIQYEKAEEGADAKNLSDI